MKTYIRYFNGVEAGYIKAGSHNAAEKKAQKQADDLNKKAGTQIVHNVSVAYTEI